MKIDVDKELNNYIKLFVRRDALKKRNSKVNIRIIKKLERRLRQSIWGNIAWGDLFLLFFFYPYWLPPYLEDKVK